MPKRNPNTKFQSITYFGSDHKEPKDKEKSIPLNQRYLSNKVSMTQTLMSPSVRKKVSLSRKSSLTKNSQSGLGKSQPNLARVNTSKF